MPILSYENEIPFTGIFNSFHMNGCGPGLAFTNGLIAVFTRARQPEVSFRWHSFLLFFVSQLAMHACVVRA